MPKLTLKDPGANYRSVAQIQDNNSLIEAAIENTISRDGTSPNQMEADLDLNSNKITNLGAPVNNTDAARKQDIDSGIGADVTTVATNITEIQTVSASIADVTAVAAVATDIGVVAADLAGADDIGTVAGAIANVNAVGQNITDITNAVSQAAAGVQRNTATGDNSTVTFALPATPWVDGVVFAYLDGVNQDDSEWSISGSNITFNTAPGTGVNIELVVITAGTVTAAQTAATNAATSEANAAASAALALASEKGFPQVDNVAALKAVDVGAISDDDLYYLKGHTAIDDGGQGLFRYDAGSAATDDDGTILQPTVGSGRWLRQYVGAVNVKWFGAAGDGATDDTSAVQAALDAGASAVLIPDGTYLCDLLTVPADDMRVLGANRSVLKARTNPTSGPVLVSVSGRADVSFEGVVFHGNTGTITSFNNVVQVFNSNRILFNRCEWTETRGIACLSSGGTRTGVLNSYFKNCGIYNRTSTLDADRRQAFACTGTTEAYAINNDFEEVGLDCISFASSSDDCVASGNRIRNNDAGSIYVASTSGFIVTGNNISNGSNGGNGVDVFASDSGVVSNNFVHGCGGSGILLANCARVVAAANVCQNNYQSATGVHKGGITLSGNSGTLEDITLTGNVCNDTQGVGSVTQRYAIGVYSSSATYRNIRISISNELTGYTSGGAVSSTAIFENTDLGMVGYPYTFNLADTSEVTLYTANTGTYGTFEVFQVNGSAYGRFFMRPSLAPLELDDPGSNYETTDTGSTQAVYRDSGSNTVRLKNRTGLTRTYVVIPGKQIEGT